MARIARVVAAGLPHHVTRRGNRRQIPFFAEDDYRFYLDQLAQWCYCHDGLLWSCCLMPNHVHLIAALWGEDGLWLAIGEIHRRYSRRINFRMGWRGHLWQGRFSSSPMDERYLIATARYVERNPVASGIVSSPGEYLWSSASHYLRQHVDPLIHQSPLSAMVDDWQAFLAGEVDAESRAAIGQAERPGRPLGDADFVAKLEGMLGRGLRRHKPEPQARGN